MAWADKYRRLGVRTNADNPHDTEQAVKFGAEGIGLCRTEHMFFEADRIPAIREMICSDTVEQREKALAKLEPLQSRPAASARALPEPRHALPWCRRRSSHGKRRFCCLQRTYALYGKVRYLLLQVRGLS